MLESVRPHDDCIVCDSVIISYHRSDGERFALTFLQSVTVTSSVLVSTLKSPASDCFQIAPRSHSIHFTRSFK